mmetsp:Transcript_21616/g.31455  ORF Transcript_21616/g.31455 Transcript_21616/m.31455 type:complete len:598 (+) Transcript_21616:97-1890(+)
MAVVDTRCLEIWVQAGIPDQGELVFNVHVRNASSVEWEVSYRLSQFGALDVEINKRTDALRDVAFPIIRKETSAAISSPGKSKSSRKELEHCRMSLELWVFHVVTRIDVVPNDLKDIIEGFFCLPNGPDNDDDASVHSAPADGGSVNTSTHGGLADLSSLKVSSSRSLPADADETASIDSEYTTGSLDENGVPKKKKRKRIIKGAKRRLSNLIGGGKKKESAGGVVARTVDASVSSRPKDRGSVISASSVETCNVLSDNSRPIQRVQPCKLLKIRVIRGGERSRGHPEYEIQLVFNIEKRPYTAAHIFSDFYELKTDIESANGVGVGAPFPTVHAKSSLGVSLTEDQHAERTRMLDTWVKDMISSYQYMNEKERMHVRAFLNLDLSLQKDIYLQDKMASGMVEAPRAALGSSSPNLDVKVIAHTSSRISDSGTSRISGRQPSFVSSRDDGTSSVLSSGSPTGILSPVRSDHKRSPAERRAKYTVKIASSGCLSSDQAISPNLKRKLDFKDSDSTGCNGKSSEDAVNGIGKATDKKLMKGPDGDTRIGGNRMSSLGNIAEEQSSCHDAATRDDKILLKIGGRDSKPNKKKMSSCCVLM